MPLPVAREPQHAATEAPVARAPRHDDGVELMLAHLASQRGVAAPVVLLGELPVDRVAVIRGLEHVGEWQRLVELAAHGLPRRRTDTGRLDIDVHRGTLAFTFGVANRSRMIPTSVNLICGRTRVNPRSAGGGGRYRRSQGMGPRLRVRRRQLRGL